MRSLIDYYASPNIRAFISMGKRWVRHVTHETRKTYKILAWKSHWKRSFG
jgi:hypothetical protein